MSDVISRRFSVQWNGLPVANLAVFVLGGLMYAARSMSISQVDELV